MTSTQQQILDELLRLLDDPQKWAFVPSYQMSDGWMKHGKVYLKAFKHMGPSSPWDYLCVVVGGDSWDVPSGVRQQLWEKAHPVFEQVRQRGTEDAASSILRTLRSFL